jgi:D-alanyl-D-alanine carboxypeptidase
VIDLPLQLEATELISFEENGEPFLATPETHDAWIHMKTAAEHEGITLILVSAFRSIARQQALVEAKRKKGHSDDEIFRLLARPGYSQHHTGCALDLHTPSSALLEESFEDTVAFTWLSEHAHEYGFTLSYPRDNPYGIVYEPWHWLYSRS